MKSILNKDICKTFDDNNIFYVYHRIDGPDDVYDFCKYANSHLKITSISVGLTNEWIELIKNMYSDGLYVDYFTVDVALSYTDSIIPILETIRKYYPDSFIIVGNGSTPEWFEWLSNLTPRVDAAKINIGVSKACRTREYTGFSNTPLTAIEQCYLKRKHCNNKLVIITDGGLTEDEKGIHIGDIAKAFVFGADWVMSGSLYARCIDSPAIITGYFGNASNKANKSNRIEGETVTIKTNEKTVEQQIQFIKECLQSSISYAGGKDLSCLNETVRYERLVL